MIDVTHLLKGEIPKGFRVKEVGRLVHLFYKGDLVGVFLPTAPIEEIQKVCQEILEVVPK